MRHDHARLPHSLLQGGLRPGTEHSERVGQAARKHLTQLGVVLLALCDTRHRLSARGVGLHACVALNAHVERFIYLSMRPAAWHGRTPARGGQGKREYVLNALPAVGAHAPARWQATGAW